MPTDDKWTAQVHTGSMAADSMRHLLQLLVAVSGQANKREAYRKHPDSFAHQYQSINAQRCDDALA